MTAAWAEKLACPSTEGSVGTVGAGFRRCWQFGWRRGRALVALVDPGWQKVMGGVGLGPGGTAERDEQLFVEE